jgi:hypothetical protein
MEWGFCREIDCFNCITLKTLSNLAQGQFVCIEAKIRVFTQAVVWEEGGTSPKKDRFFPKNIREAPAPLSMRNFHFVQN